MLHGGKLRSVTDIPTVWAYRFASLTAPPCLIAGSWCSAWSAAMQPGLPDASLPGGAALRAAAATMRGQAVGVCPYAGLCQSLVAGRTPCIGSQGRRRCAVAGAATKPTVVRACAVPVPQAHCSSAARQPSVRRVRSRLPAQRDNTMSQRASSPCSRCASRRMIIMQNTSARGNSHALRSCQAGPLKAQSESKCYQKARLHGCSSGHLQCRKRCGRQARRHRRPAERMQRKQPCSSHDAGAQGCTPLQRLPAMPAWAAQARATEQCTGQEHSACHRCVLQGHGVRGCCQQLVGVPYAQPLRQGAKGNLLGQIALEADALLRRCSGTCRADAPQETAHGGAEPLLQVLPRAWWCAGSNPHVQSSSWRTHCAATQRTPSLSRRARRTCVAQSEPPEATAGRCW